MASKARVSLYVSRELREAIGRSAAENDRSLSAEVRVALRAYTSRRSSDAPALASEGQERSGVAVA